MRVTVSHTPLAHNTQSTQNTMPRLRLSSPVWLVAGLLLLVAANMLGFIRMCSLKISADADLRYSLRAQLKAHLANPMQDTHVGEQRLNFLKTCKHACDTPMPRSLHRITWVHIPKCGTSLGLVLFNYACVPEVSPSVVAAGGQSAKTEKAEKASASQCRCSDLRKWDPNIVEHLWSKNVRLERTTCHPDVQLLGDLIDHRPERWRGAGIDALGGSLVTMIRDPRKRLVAAYNDGKHASGLTEDRGDAFLQVSTFEEYVTFPGIRGCQTKMVLGYLCTDPKELTREDSHEAKRRLEQDFAFVGLTDAWNMSTCLFHRMFGGELTLESFKNLRPGHHVSSAFRPGDLMKDSDLLQPMNKVLVGNATFVDPGLWESLLPTVDPFDWQLYVVAKRLFYERVLKYALNDGWSSLSDWK